MENIQYRSGAIDASECISQAWELVKRNLGLYVGGCLVMLILISCIPIVNFFLIGPMFGGWAYLVLRDIRNEPVDFGMIFKGFEKFVPLMVLGLIQAIPGIIFQIFQYTIDFSSIMGVPSPSGGGGADFFQSSQTGVSPLASGMLAGFFVIFFFFWIFQLVWNAVLLFAIPLVIETDASIGEAITTSFGAVFSNLGGLIVLILLGVLVGLLGVLALCIGIFVATPVIYAGNVIAYRQVFPYVDGPTGYTGPPPPTVYDGTFGRGQ
jgi:uncharacterized membrane protein